MLRTMAGIVALAAGLLMVIVLTKRPGIGCTHAR